MNSKYESAMNMAINGAEQFLGATSPQPPAGIIALDKKGKVLLGASRQNASGPSAEAKLLDLAQKLGKLAEIETLVATIEPDAELILKNKNIRRVVIGAMDPNPSVQAAKSNKLRSAGLEIITGVLEQECQFLIRAYAKFVSTGQPWVTLSAAFGPGGAMISLGGEKTLSSKPSLIFIHELRKRADAIWTGSGTVLADSPNLEVNWVPDHPQKRRQLVLSDRRKRIGTEWLQKAAQSGFAKPYFADTLQSGLDFLASQKVQEVLVEAGPLLRDAWLESNLWDESVVILQGEGDSDDEIDIQFRHEAGEA